MELTDEPHYIYPEADENLLDPILQPFVNLGLISNQDITNMQQAIINSKGSKVDITLFIPPFWLGLEKSRAELETMGFFPEPTF